MRAEVFVNCVAALSQAHYLEQKDTHYIFVKRMDLYGLCSNFQKDFVQTHFQNISYMKAEGIKQVKKSASV